MKKFILVIDGPMGAGKTTVTQLLHPKLKQTARIGLDIIKWFVSDFKRTPEQNKKVIAVLQAMTDAYLKQGISVLLDNAMKMESVKKYQAIAKKNKAEFIMYQLEAPKDLLEKRVKARPPKEGKPKISQARIDRNHRSFYDNRYPNAIVLDSQKLNPKQIANRIFKDLKK